MSTPQQVIDALRAARANFTLAARSLTSPERPNGISRETVYQYIRRHPEIANALRDIHEERGHPTASFAVNCDAIHAALGWWPQYAGHESGLEQTLLTWRAAAARG